MLHWGMWLRVIVITAVCVYVCVRPCVCVLLVFVFQNPQTFKNFFILYFFILQRLNNWYVPKASNLWNKDDALVHWSISTLKLSTLMTSLCDVWEMFQIHCRGTTQTNRKKQSRSVLWSLGEQSIVKMHFACAGLNLMIHSSELFIMTVRFPWMYCT